MKTLFLLHPSKHFVQELSNKFVFIVLVKKNCKSIERATLITSGKITRKKELFHKHVKFYLHTLDYHVQSGYQKWLSGNKTLKWLK